MKEVRLDWFRWYAAEFARITAGWTFGERSVFRALLDVQWMCGVVPLERTRIAECIRCSRGELDRAWPKVKTQFMRQRGGYLNVPLEQERQLSLKLYSARADGMKKARTKRPAAQSQCG